MAEQGMDGDSSPGFYYLEPIKNISCIPNERTPKKSILPKLLREYWSGKREN